MADFIGIGHFFELTRTEAIAGFFTPLAIFIVFLLLQLLLAGHWVPGYVVDRETGEPRKYRLNGILVFVIAVLVWAFELTGMPRDWFYRTTIYAMSGGTFFSLILTLIAMYSQPRKEKRSFIADLWVGRAQELSFFGNRFDVKMYLYVVGGTMLSLNAMSGAAWHYDQFGDMSNPGVFLYAAFFTFYIFDYFVFERVQLYTYDLIHEKLGFKLLWGGLMIYGWMYILPLWGMAAVPDPGFSTAWTYVWLIGTGALFLLGWSITRGANLQKYTFKRWPDRKFLGLIEPRYIEAGERKILFSGFWRPARHFNYLGEGLLALSVALVFGHFANPWAWTYFVCIVTLFTIRQLEDEAYCAEKYGPEKWAEYQARVKYRIFPGVW